MRHRVMCIREIAVCNVMQTRKIEPMTQHHLKIQAVLPMARVEICKCAIETCMQEITPETRYQTGPKKLCIL
jgi:hypothetical protein